MNTIIENKEFDLDKLNLEQYTNEQLLRIIHMAAHVYGSREDDKYDNAVANNNGMGIMYYGTMRAISVLCNFLIDDRAVLYEKGVEVENVLDAYDAINSELNY